MIKDFFVKEVEWIYPIMDFPNTHNIQIYAAQKTTVLNQKYATEDIKWIDNFYNSCIMRETIRLVQFIDNDNQEQLHQLGFSHDYTFDIFSHEVPLLTKEEQSTLHFVNPKEYVSSQLN